MDTEEQHHFHIVFPQTVFKKLRSVAKRNNRTVRAQVLFMLEQSLKKERSTSDEPDELN